MGQQLQLLFVPSILERLGSLERIDGSIYSVFLLLVAGGAINNRESGELMVPTTSLKSLVGIMTRDEMEVFIVDII